MPKSPRPARPQSSTAPRREPSAESVAFSPFHQSAMDYFHNGYLPFPLPLGKKAPPPSGVPNEIVIDLPQIHAWLTDPQPKNIGTIVPDGMVVIDVDGPVGKETMRELENRLGPLPNTWISFRGDPDRYHLWFKTPNGMHWPGKLGAGVDLIHSHYRYMVIPPSIHPDGTQYRWAKP